MEVWQEKGKRKAGRKSLIIIRDGYGGTRIRFLVTVQAASRNNNGSDKSIYKLIKLGLN